MNKINIFRPIVAVLCFLLYCDNLCAENIDPAEDGSQYAYGENVGWINFDPTYGGVTIDSDGDFDGWAWGENIGWIHFQSTGPVAYKVKVCVVYIETLLADISAQWLDTGPDLTADLHKDGVVNLYDFGVLASYWLDYCPDDWLPQKVGRAMPAIYSISMSLYL